MEDIVVELQSGLIRGVIEKHKENFNYYAFKGIPYAEPPVGELRFQDPVPIKKWKGIIECKNYGPWCLQQNVFIEYKSYSEDCLHLNVYTRAIENHQLNQAVIVVLHGGGLIFGSGDDLIFGPDYLIRKDVVLVTVNHRLGVLGFLNLEDEIAPGNQGLRDILVALQWIQQNIRVFGGDPGNVTVLGVGGSGAVIHLLALSELTKGLIHKVISLSTSLYASWMHIPNPKTYAIELCSLLGRQLTDSRDIFNFLKTVDAKCLLEAQERLRNSLTRVVFGITVDSKSPNPILPTDRCVLADQGVPLPILTGYTSAEGIVALYGLSRKEFYDICDRDFHKIYHYSAGEIAERYNLKDAQMRRLYYEDETVSDKNLDKFVNFANDVYFIESIHKLVRVQVERNVAPIYLYNFSYDSPLSMLKQVIKDVVPGAAHLDDLSFLFKMRLLESFGVGYFEKGTKEYQLMDRMTEMCTNFAKYGKPTIATSDLIPVQWLPVDDVTNFRYLNIDENMSMQSTVNVEQKLTAAKNIKI